MQISSVNNSINFNASIGQRLESTINNNYPSFFQRSKKNQIKAKIISATENNDIIDVDFRGNIYIQGNGTNWEKRNLTTVKFDRFSFFVDEEVADEIVKKAQE